MKRSLTRLEDVASVQTLAGAFWRAARGKRDRPVVKRFEAKLNDNLRRLGDQIVAETLRLGDSRSFEIRDPKRRTIHAPAFRERVFHHALMLHAGPVFERSLVEQTFACRKSKGSLAAVRFAQRQARRYRWFARLDVRGYFASIDHQILKRAIRRRIKGPPVLRWFDRVVESHGAPQGRGVPVGALTSQHFGNQYLDRVDRFLLEDRKMAMVRYMDDVVVWGDERGALSDALDRARELARGDLALDLVVKQPPTRTTRGAAFLGFRVFPFRRLLSRRRSRRFVAARRRWEEAYRNGLVKPEQLQAGYGAALAVTAHARARGLRSNDLSQRRPPDV